MLVMLGVEERSLPQTSQNLSGKSCKVINIVMIQEKGTQYTWNLPFYEITCLL